MSLFITARNNYIVFLSAANRIALQLENFVKIDENVFLQTQNFLDAAKDMLESFLTSLQIGIIVASILGFIIFLLSCLSLLIDFRRRVFAMRRGDYDYDIKKFNLITMTMLFIPYHVSNSMLAFLFYFLAFTVAITFIVWPMLWIIIWENITLILTIIITAVINKIGLIIAKKVIYNEKEKTFKNRPLVAGFELY